MGQRTRTPRSAATVVHYTCLDAERAIDAKGVRIHLGDTVRSSPEIGGNWGGVVVAIGGTQIMFMTHAQPRRFFCQDACDLLRHLDIRDLPESGERHV